MKNLVMTFAAAAMFFAACDKGPEANKEIVGVSNEQLVKNAALYESDAISNSSGSRAGILAASTGLERDAYTTSKPKTKVIYRTVEPSTGSVANNTTTTTTTTTQKKGWSKAAKGAVIGGVTGGVTGAIISKNKVAGAVIGTVIGAGGGYVIGRGMDKKDGR